MTTAVELAREVAGDEDDAPSNLTQHEVQELTAQFFVTLRASVARLALDDRAQLSPSYVHIRDLLNRKGKQTWTRAYEIEQLLVDVMDDKTLDIELETRLLEARTTLGAAKFEHFTERVNATQAADDRRAVLGRLINDLQWRHTVNEVKRAYSKEITARTGTIFITTIAAFAATVLIVAFFGVRFSPDGETRPLMLLLAGVAGAWGAGFSMLSSLKARLDAAELNDLKLMKARSLLWSRPLIGVGAACILYFFLASGLLSGEAFPKVDPVAPTQPVASGTTGTPPASQTPTKFPHERKDMAMLIVWCFLAGFSERLVPALLAKTEDERMKPQQSGTGRQDSSAAGKGTKTT
jgi:hypothetical protein